MGEPLVLYRVEDGIARISINDPARLNAMSEAMGAALLAALSRAMTESRVVVLTGEGPAFCSGANLDDAMEMLDDPARDGGGQIERVFNPLLLAMRAMEQPIVTVVRGAAAGVGCGLAMAGDIILCSDTAYFFHAFSKVGLVPDGGSSWLLSKAIGRIRAMRLMLLGERLPASQALEWGLITQLVPDGELDAATQKIARTLAAGPKSLGATKKLAWAALETDFATALGAERSAQREASRTADFCEGVRAFSERRKPRFAGR